ncbi:MAG: flagellar basal body P-ring protein FlgI [Synergistaceae bacterium]|nr:flagellar basal body P-ring protein FlgI [Synergistaceae bacterium]MBQ3760009.1 flagellar basal body P-ring protein FlgI [Synergistaceae bacterium]MBQ6114100.1 flagellar basal body P-ring protein FlgI [Synergistaceae bacterium]MBQ6419049.1 flagellar basal body P-ring protein FlgI [Synergistaceae bacterium]MBQ6981854.1 flagellar basal body P-ring protein FlgI [Synergistaceae bacterium]
MMRKFLLAFAIVAVMAGVSFGAVNLQDMDFSRVNPTVRIKDITEVEGARGNQLTGVGLVTGLNGTGDNSPMAVQMMRNMMRNFGITLDARSVRTRNLAVVALTANLPPYVRPGQTIDVNVNTMGNASNLQGGVLVQSPLRAADGQVYAVAQGPVIVGGSSAQGAAASRTQNVPTAGRVPGGAIVEREVPADYSMGGQVALLLRQPDSTTSQRIADAINRVYGVVAYAVDAGRVEINLPGQYVQAPNAFLASMGGIEIEPDTTAKVAVNERNGTIVMGGNVRISAVGVAHGNLVVTIGETANVVQPESLSGGVTAYERRTDITADEDGGSMIAMPATTTVRDLVRVLNSLGARPRDIIEILQAISKAGALHGELVVM